MTVAERERLVFPYRLVLRHADGTIETLDPALLPMPVENDQGMDLRVSDVDPAVWKVERIVEERDSVPTEREFGADPTIRLGTVS